MDEHRDQQDDDRDADPLTDVTNGDDLDGCVPVRLHGVSFYYGLGERSVENDLATTVSAPAVTPHFFKMAPYVPFAIKVLIAAWIATASLLTRRGLRRRDAVGRDFDGLADQLEHALGLRDDVAGDLAVDEAERRVTRGDRQVRLGLGRVRTAPSASCWPGRPWPSFVGVALLRGTGLDGDRESAEALETREGRGRRSSSRRRPRRPGSSRRS